MSEEKKAKEARMPKLWEALITMLFLVIMLAVGIIIYGVDPHVPMFVGVIGAALMALHLGYKWDAIEKSMMDGIFKALQSIVILTIIGILIGVWINAGVVPSMIYYGLKILKPSIFFIAAMLICSITSLATGTSWGTMGTMGVALMGIGLGLGMNPAMTAGAIISGAYFGDKMSPLSDTTNLAPAMAGTDVMTHVKFMMLPTGIVYGICLIFYGVLGITQYHGGSTDMSQVRVLSDALNGLFNVNPLLLLPPIIVIVAVACKIPAIPGITLGIISGGICGLIFQPGCNLGTLFNCGINGYVCATGVESIDKLLSTGGLLKMMFSVSMTIIAMMFGGIMEYTHQLEVIVNKLKAFARTPATLVTLTEVTCVISNATMPEQYISIVVPGRMYAEEYKKMGLHPKSLSNALEGAGTVTSALIPWNTCGVFIFTTLGIGVSQYAPYAVFNWLMPIVVIVMAFMGLTVCDLDGVRLAKKKKMEKAEKVAR
ncbi:sodium/proton antiporter NhaC [Oscillibacter valericigenes Sjm18-20]|nr:sodium/proton antiporter NhaC [Oscillibacter valericigenes Sjm18-20]